jgi:hypothetical protein
MDPDKNYRAETSTEPRPAVVLVGAEGVSELGDPPPDWIRAATTDEQRAFNAMLVKEKGLQDPADAYIDSNGRPYWLMTVDPDAPQHILDRAQCMVRVVRFTEG